MVVKRLVTGLAVTWALISGAAQAEPMTRSASGSVDATVERFLTVLEGKGATVFAVVDHAGGAAKVDMELAPATLVVFGNPKIGTPIMHAAPDMGLELPLRVLFRDDGAGGTSIVYPDMRAIAAEYGVAEDHPALAKAVGALDGLTKAVAK